MDWTLTALLSSACRCTSLGPAAAELREAGASCTAAVAVACSAADFSTSGLEAGPRGELLAAGAFADVTEEPAGGGGGARDFLDDGLAELTPGALGGLVDLCAD